MQSTSASALSVLRDTVRLEGVTTLFRGYALTLGVFGPYSAIYFAIYEQAKALCAHINKQPVAQLPSYQILLAAAASAAVASAATSPLDVVKTRLQTSARSRFRSGVHALREIVRTEGVGALVRGMSARVMWVTPGTAVTMVSYELYKRLLGLPQ